MDFTALKKAVLAEYPDARVVRYFGGDEQMIVAADREDLGKVTRYSDGKSETVINLY